MRAAGFAALVALIAAGALRAQSAAPRSTGTDAVAVVLRVVDSIAVPRDTIDRESPEPIGLGALLRPGDRVVPPSGGHLLVLHAGGDLERIEESRRIEDPGVEATGLFRVIRAQLRRPAAPAGVREPPGPGAFELPVRPTGDRRVRSLTPTLIWRASEGAEGYRIHLWHPEGRIMTVEISADTSWTLPADQALTPGMAFEWAVDPFPGGRVSTRATFKVASREVLDEVASELGRMREAGLDPGGDGLLAAAIVFRALGLPYDAADALAELSTRAEPWSPELTAFRQRLADELEPRTEAENETGP